MWGKNCATCNYCFHCGSGIIRASAGYCASEPTASLLFTLLPQMKNIIYHYMKDIVGVLKSPPISWAYKHWEFTLHTVWTLIHNTHCISKSSLTLCSSVSPFYVFLQWLLPWVHCYCYLIASSTCTDLCVVFWLFVYFHCVQCSTPS